MADSKLIPLARLYENISKKTGKTYLAGNLSFTSKLLVFRNEDAAEGEPQWTIFLAEREPKPDARPVAGPPTAYDAKRRPIITGYAETEEF